MESTNCLIIITLNCLDHCKSFIIWIFDWAYNIYNCLSYKYLTTEKIPFSTIYLTDRWLNAEYCKSWSFVSSIYILIVLQNDFWLRKSYLCLVRLACKNVLTISHPFIKRKTILWVFPNAVNNFSSSSISFPTNKYE